MSRLEGKVDTGWGYEIIWVTTDKYCGKLLCFNGPGSKTSMHFHKEKEKSWFVNSGQFMLRYIDTTTAELMQVPLKEGSTYNLLPLQPHQLVAMTEDAVIFEVSTSDSTEDVYRIGPGDNITKHAKPNE